MLLKLKSEFTRQYLGRSCILPCGLHLVRRPASLGEPLAKPEVHLLGTAELVV